MMDDINKDAEAIVRALDAYLATFPWPAPTINTASSTEQTSARMFLVRTFAAVLGETARAATRLK
jgi:hypothetical protein